MQNGVWNRSEQFCFFTHDISDLHGATLGIMGEGAIGQATAAIGRVLFGPLGFGALKLALHRACIARLFERNDLLLDAEEIYAIAKTMVGENAQKP